MLFRAVDPAKSVRASCLPVAIIAKNNDAVVQAIRDLLDRMDR